MATFQERAQRGLILFDGLSGSENERTARILTHVLDESNRDDYISRDFFNVQQTAGGLPDGVTFEQFVSLIEGHVRDDLQGSSFDEGLPDEDFRLAALTFDDTIRRHMRFLNGVVHQAAPGEVHRLLFDRILAARDDDTSVYSVYRDFLIDA